MRRSAKSAPKASPMAATNQASLGNRLLALLDARQYAHLQPYLEAIELPRDMVLIEPYQQIEYAYFPESGVVSIVTATAPVIEVGLFGREGMSSLVLLMGADRTPHRQFVANAVTLVTFTFARLLCTVVFSTVY